MYYVIYGRPLNCAVCVSSGSAIDDVIIGSSSHFDLKGMLFLSKQKVGDRMEVGFGPKTRGHLSVRLDTLLVPLQWMINQMESPDYFCKYLLSRNPGLRQPQFYNELLNVTKMIRGCDDLRLCLA